MERFETHYAQTVGTERALFAGVMPRAARAAEARATPMSVVTNKPRYFTEKLLERLGGEAAAARACVAGDDGIRRKPHGDMLVAACKHMDSGAERVAHDRRLRQRRARGARRRLPGVVRALRLQRGDAGPRRSPATGWSPPIDEAARLLLVAR